MGITLRELPANAQTLTVETYGWLGSQSLTLSPERQHYEVSLCGGTCPDLELLIQNRDRRRKNERPKGELSNSNSALRDAEDRGYFQRHELVKYMRRMLNKTLEERPDDPLRFMSEYARAALREPSTESQFSVPTVPSGPATRSSMCDVDSASLNKCTDGKASGVSVRKDAVSPTRRATVRQVRRKSGADSPCLDVPMLVTNKSTAPHVDGMTREDALDTGAPKLRKPRSDLTESVASSTEASHPLRRASPAPVSLPTNSLASAYTSTTVAHKKLREYRSSGPSHSVATESMASVQAAESTVPARQPSPTDSIASLGGLLSRPPTESVASLASEFSRGWPSLRTEGVQDWRDGMPRVAG